MANTKLQKAEKELKDATTAFLKKGSAQNQKKMEDAQEKVNKIKGSGGEFIPAKGLLLSPDLIEVKKDKSDLGEHRSS